MIQIKIDSPDTLFSLAAAMEREATERYEALAAAMRDGGNPEAAEVFDGLAAEERSHENQIAAWAGRELGEDLPREPVEWQTGEVFALEVEDLEDPHTLTPYRALSIAVHNEERAFAFFSYVAANTDNPTVRAYAEGLAREELSHAAALRRHRRAAYHRQCKAAPRDRWGLSQRSPQRRGELAKIAAALEAGLAQDHSALAERLGREAPQEAETLTALAATERENAEELGGGEALSPAHGTQDLRDCLQDLETVYDFYTRAGERARDQEALALAQDLAERTIRRIARLRQALSVPAA